MFTDDELKAFFNGFTRRLTWQVSVDLYNKLKVHADGEVPIRLINNMRPNESQAVFDYRQKIYEAETQNPIERVIGVLEKIHRSPDWMIRFEGEVPKIIKEGESLEDYLTINYPVYGSIENWWFEETLRTICLDANAVVVVMPESFEIVETEYIKPVCTIYNSQNVVDFVSDNYAVVKSDELSSLLTAEENQQYMMNLDALKITSFSVGQVYYIITTVYYQKWEQNRMGTYTLTQQFNHNLGQLPVFQIPGKFLKRVGNYVVKKTLLFPMVPHLNKAARESNDLDIGVVKHLHLKEWEINSTDCKKCKGTGQIINPATSTPCDCDKCEGTGISTGTSPADKLRIKPKALGATAIPVPPAGFIVMDPGILIIANDRVKEHIYKSLESVNMEHLGDSPLDQSGVAKAYDRDEANTTVYTHAEMLTYVENLTVYFINELRYKTIIPNKADRDKMLPVIPVPEKFDIVNTSILLQEYQVAKAAGISSIILGEMQKEISQKKFYANPDVSNFVQTVMDMDPFFDKTTEEKVMLETSNLVTREDVTLSIYITEFVKEAVDNDKDFYEKEYDEKKAILVKLAQEKLKELDKAKEEAMANDIMMMAAQGGQQQQDNGEETPPDKAAAAEPDKTAEPVKK